MPEPVKPAPADVATPSAPAFIRDITVRSEIAELRGLCLARMDATAVASLAPERLLTEVERLLSELATEHRIQLNGREQRQLASELVDDMMGLGPLEPLLEDETINDIMVNGPERVFVERSG
ncbi:MAG TPA: CpaF family protein, partial [Acetobacteraceae bacterium]|nr:CpaF family protein [Acetobacteraceae bacterium]